MSTQSKYRGVFAAGLALFSMFFGAGNLIWPLILGGELGSKVAPGIVGLLVAGVSLPLLGLMTITLFHGDYKAFFNQVGVKVGFVLLLVIQLIFGPLEALPRLLTLTYATATPYLPSAFSLSLFSVAAALVVFFFAARRQRVVEIIGLVLCPLLLLTLGAILVRGLMAPPAADIVQIGTQKAFFTGLYTGYSTLDLVSSFIFAPFVLSYFVHAKAEGKVLIHKMVMACMIAGLLLAGVYIGLTFVASHYVSRLPSHLPEERLTLISQLLLGPKGALLSSAAVVLSCLTTAIPIAVISGEYLHDTLLRKKGPVSLGIALSLTIALLFANLGFSGIAAMLSPILQIVCPGLILLCILSIMHKLYRMPVRKTPVLAAFALAFFVRLVIG